jgi:hypothetical protein
VLFKARVPVILWQQVKEPLKAPFIFLFILICTTVILSALNVIYTWGMLDSSSVRPFSLAYAAQRLPRSVFDMLIPAVVLSIVLLGFRLARRPFSRFLGLLIVLGVSYVVLVNGMIWLRAFSQRVPPVAERPQQYLQPYTFVRIGGSEIAVQSVSGSAVRGILRYQPTAAESRLSVFAGGKAVTRGGTLILTSNGTPPVTIMGTPDLSWSSLFTADRFTGFFLRDVGTLTADFQRLLGASLGEFFAACFALLFLCTASLVLLRITRWPLANIMLLVIVFRGYFSLYHLLAVQLAPRVAAVVSDRLAVQMFPAAVMAGIGVILLLVDIIFIPANRWKSEQLA